ncbi:hypothetical protein R1sor_027068 [Riccia sorocarpa]|uniref:DUF4371 domain-containing protein n=1 Tax=Riccia sorocarpa TaxID=122646 RepID=A0ABD3GGB0_9MARC
MSKRPVQNTLERSGFTVTKKARRKSAEGTGETSVIRDEEAHHLDGSPVTNWLIERNRRRWYLNSSKWMIDYPWLGFDYETGKAFCKSCSTGNGKTICAKDGTYNVKTSAFSEHGGGDDHHSVLVVQTLGDKPMDRILKTAASMCNDAMLTLFRAAYFVGKHSLTFSNFPPFCELLKTCTSDIPVKLYQRAKSCIDFIFHISQILQSQVLEKVRASPLYGIMIDESTDVSVTGHLHLVVFCTFLEYGQVKTAFLGLLHIQKKDSGSITAELIARLRLWGLDFSKMLGFGSDGASTMLGSKNGVAVRLKREVNPFLTATHCVAHRTNLASLAAAKSPKCKLINLSEPEQNGNMYLHESLTEGVSETHLVDQSLLQFQTNVPNRDALNRTNPITKKGTMTYFDII